jgi:preprotein translocase subunit YajC
VAGLDDKTLLVQVADNVKLKFDRSAVAMIIKEGESEPKS